MKKVPFTMIAIPGTHDSATHKMRIDQPMSYDSFAYDLTKNSVLKVLSIGANPLLAGWGRCVKHNIEEHNKKRFLYSVSFLF